jgi:hypothetical protein
MDCQTSTPCRRLTDHMQLDEERAGGSKKCVVLNTKKAVLFTACGYVYKLINII